MKEKKFSLLKYLGKNNDLDLFLFDECPLNISHKCKTTKTYQVLKDKKKKERNTVINNMKIHLLML